MRLRAALLLLLAPGQAALGQPPECPVHTGVEDVYGEPLLQAPIAANAPVPLAPGTVLALEQARVATRIWRAEQPIVLPGRFRFTYPAGAPITALRTRAGIRRCLRDAASYGRGPSGGSFIPCLIDVDGNGDFEAAEMFHRDQVITYWGREARFARTAIVPLAAPVRLREDPEGLATGRTYAFRRIRVDALQPDSVSLIIEHARQAGWITEQVAATGADGRRVRHRRSRLDTASAPAFVAWPGSRRTYRLVDGQAIRAGGIRFRLARAGGGWTATPLEQRFPPWIRHACEGSTVEIGSD